MFCDFHTHILPGIDDGAADLNMSLSMLKLLQKQGVDTVVATPHYYAHRQPLENFVQKRSQALSQILNSNADHLPKIIPGAEVYLEQGLKQEDLHPLCTQGTPYILIEMPYMPYAGWMLEEVYNISLRQSLTPIFAHLDRYDSFYSDDEIREILDFEDAVIQVNNSALYNHKTLKTVLSWIKEGRTIVMGSDCHNTTSRDPDDDRAQSVLKSKLGKSWLEDYRSLTEAILYSK